MHPPLDRPHPDCQKEIDELRECHDTSSKFKFWACNEIKTRLDVCFKEEKRRSLEILNRDMDATKATEQAQAAIAMNQTQTFAEYLQNDKQYQKDLEKEKQKQDSWWNQYFRVR